MKSRDDVSRQATSLPQLPSTQVAKEEWPLREATTWVSRWTGQRRHGRRLGRVVVVVLALLALCILGVGIYDDLNRHTLQGTTPLSIDQSLVVTHASLAARELGFQVRDRFLRIGETEVATLLDYRRALNSQKSDAWTSAVIDRNGGTVRVPVFVSTQPIDMAFVVLYLTAAAFLAMGILVAWQRGQDKAARLFALTALAVGLYLALLRKETVILVYMQLFFLTLAPGLIIHFFLTYPQERKMAKWPLSIFLYAPSLVLMVLTLWSFSQSVAAGTGIWGAPWFEALWNLGFVYLTMSALIGLISLYYYAYRRTPSSSLKRQLQWIMWGLFCFVVAGNIAIILTVMQVQTSAVSTILLLGMIPLPIAFAFAFLRYRLLDTDLVVSRSVVYALLTATLAAVYLLFITLLSNALGVATGSGPYTLVVFLSAFIIGILVNPVRARIQGFLDRYFFRQQIGYQDALSKWSQELSTSIRFDDLAELLTVEVPQHLLIDRAWLLVLEEDEQRLSPLQALAAAEGEEDGEPLTVTMQEAIAANLLQPGSVLLPAKNERERDVDLLANWQEAGVQVMLPLLSGEKLQGVYLLGHKLSGDIYQRRELDILRTLANQAAIAIANARLYEEIRALSQVLENKVQERTQELRDSLSVVYHELNSPITSIRGYTALLLDGRAGALNTRQTRFLGTVRRSVMRLMRLVADLSDISKIDGGRLALTSEPLNLEEVVEEATSTYSGIIEQKGLQVSSHVAPEASLVLGDPQRVAQILTNLVSNACHYTPAGGRITISAVRADGFSEIAVHDTGIGISEEEQDKVFGRFYRSSDPLVQEQPGTGLGLAITKSLVELHNGRIRVDSAPGRGSAFIFTLPLASQGVRRQLAARKS
jgi:signal transduction histidine kinase